VKQNINSAIRAQLPYIVALLGQPHPSIIDRVHQQVILVQNRILAEEFLVEGLSLATTLPIADLVTFIPAGDATLSQSDHKVMRHLNMRTAASDFSFTSACTAARIAVGVNNLQSIMG